MRPLRISAPPGLCILPQLWDEPENGGVPGLWTEGRFELEGMRFVVKDNWKISLVVPPGEQPATFAAVPWQLFDLAADRGETLNLAASRPEKVSELLAEWDTYVAQNGVLLTVGPRPAGRDEAAP